MKTRHTRTIEFGILAFLAAGMVLSICACNHGRPCLDLKLAVQVLLQGGLGELYGATDINAISGNQRLSAAFNQEGTITVLKWPTPSFYDQVKYMTTQRTKPRLGALDNEGIFAGIYFEAGSERGFFWLRDLPHVQSYLGPRSIAVKTSFQNRKLGLEIDQTDFVDSGADVLWRNWQLKKLEGSPLTFARLVAYSSFAPAVSKWKSLPMADWCFDPLADSTLKWDRQKQIFYQFKSGRDQSIGKPSSVAIGFGFADPAARHFAGTNHACSMKKNYPDPYILAQKPEFPEADSAQGKPSAILAADLSFDRNNQAQASFLIAAAENQSLAADLIDDARRKGFERALAETENHWQALLKKVPLPQTPNQRIQEVALRSVITILLASCPDSGAIVDSFATQPPYGEDWLRDGSYTNEALMAAGFFDLVKKHNLFYARVQSRPGHKLAGVPSGNWASNYYADGVPAMPFIPWELDETGFALWTLFRYFEKTGDQEYLEQVYPALKRAADFMLKFKDPATGLPRHAFESDELVQFQSIRGALSVDLGLKFAIKAAKAMNDDASARKWQHRQKEVEQALFQNFYDPRCCRFVRFAESRGDCEKPGAGWELVMLLWPAELLDFSDPRAQAAALERWKEVELSITGQRDRGLYEPYELLSLCQIWKDQPQKMDLVRNALSWEAAVPTTDTGHFGEIWLRINNKVFAGQATPQLWHHALFYLSSLEAF